MFLAVMGFITISAQYAAAQTPDSAATTTTVTETPAAITNPADLTSQDETPIHQQLKTKFIEDYDKLIIFNFCYIFINNEYRKAKINNFGEFVILTVNVKTVEFMIKITSSNIKDIIIIECNDRY